MSDNPTEVEATALPLPDYRLLEIAGRDAMAFAQAQFMNDVAALADGQWQWSGWLTPKGRVVALFALLRLDDRTLWLLLPDFAPVDLAAALRTYVFRSHVTMTTRDDLRVSGTRDAHARPREGSSSRRRTRPAYRWAGPVIAASISARGRMTERMPSAIQAGIRRICGQASRAWSPPNPRNGHRNSFRWNAWRPTA